MAGTRFELTLQSSEGSQRALYAAAVHRDDAIWTGVVEITPTVARVIENGAALDAPVAKQLEAIARTLGRRADEATPWPRRIARWRQAGVR